MSCNSHSDCKTELSLLFTIQCLVVVGRMQVVATLLMLDVL
jgi:hypothetical protein